MHERTLFSWLCEKKKSLTGAGAAAARRRRRGPSEVGRRDGELGPVVDVVAVRGALEQPVQPVVEAVQQLVLEDGEVVGGVQQGQPGVLGSGKESEHLFIES